MRILQHLKRSTKRISQRDYMSSLELMNLESLKIVTFWKIVETNDVELLDAKYKHGNKYSNEQIIYLNSYWVKLYDEFYNLRNNKSGKYLMNKNSELSELSLI